MKEDLWSILYVFIVFDLFVICFSAVVLRISIFIDIIMYNVSYSSFFFKFDGIIKTCYCHNLQKRSKEGYFYKYHRIFNYYLILYGCNILYVVQ